MEPKIRFKGFEGEWIETSLSNLSSNFKYGINAAAVSFDGENKYLRITDIDDTMHSFLQNDVTSPGTDLSCCDEYLMQDGDIVIARTGASVGKSYIYHPFDGKVYFAGFLIRMRLNENTNRDFVFQNTLTNAYAKHVQFVSQRSGQPGINVNELQAYKLRIPSLSEQQFIATYFRTLDNKIQSTSKKLASLKKLKSASLVAMFPQNGESTPKVRFKGFEGEWKETTLSECLDISYLQNSENKYDKNDVLSVSDDFGVMNQIELLGRSYAGKDVSSYSILQKGEIVYTKSPLKDKPFGIIKKNSYQTGIVSILYAVYHSKDNISADYIHYYFDPAWRLNAYMRPLVNKGAKNTMNISDEMALMGSLIIPPSLAEQQAIAAYFRSLDRKIALETARLEKLKQIKLACLDKMFV